MLKSTPARKKYATISNVVVTYISYSREWMYFRFNSVLYVRYVMKPSPMMNKVGSGPMQLTGPLSNQAPPYVRCYTPPSNNTNTVGQAIASPTDYGIILKFVLLSIRYYPTKPHHI